MKESGKKIYVVRTREVWALDYELEADSEEDAIEIIKKHDHSKQVPHIKDYTGEMEFIMNPKIWDVRVKNQIKGNKDD